MPNFHYHAYQYLDVWNRFDKRFCGVFAGDILTRSERLNLLQEASAFYAVARTLPLSVLERENPGSRLDSALSAVDGCALTQTEAEVDSVDSLVGKLATALQGENRSRPTSAATKFLWLKFKSPIIIYDARAWTALQRIEKFSQDELNGYPTYYNAWRKAYNKAEGDIRKACGELVQVRNFTYCPTSDEISSLVSAQWFHERVFDMFLWDTGDPIPKRAIAPTLLPQAGA
jgi:hypothetical protein